MKYFILLLFLFFSNFQAKEYQKIINEGLKYQIDNENKTVFNQLIKYFLPFVQVIFEYFIKNIDWYSTDNNGTYYIQQFIETIKNYSHNFNENKQIYDLFVFGLLKWIINSSKNKNDVTPYRECSEDFLNFDKEKYRKIMNFYIIKINKKKNEREKFKLIKAEFNQNKCKNNLKSEVCKKLRSKFEFPFPSFRYDNESFSFGLCLPHFKLETNYSEGNYTLLIFEILNFTKIFNLNNKDDIKIIEMKNLSNNKDINELKDDDKYNLIPFYIIIIIIFIMLFGKPPKILFKSCFIKKENEEENNLNNHLIDNQNFDKKHFLRFQKKFSLKSNWQELMNYKNSSSDKINNDSGLLYIKGLRGLSMIFLSFGFLFVNLFNSPISIYAAFEFEKFLKSFTYFIFFFGIRYAPRILLSCSGYILFCKLINYLDEKSDEELERKIRKKDSNELKAKLEAILETSEEESIDNFNFSENENEKEQNMKQYKNSLRKRKVDDVKLYFLIQFILYQIHKYIFFILILSFCLFSLPIKYKIEYLFYFSDRNGVVFLDTMWKIFKNDYIDNTKTFLNLFLAYTSTYSFLYRGDEQENLLYCFWLFYNEVIFFLISSTIIFFGYKYKLKIDRFFKIVIIVTLMIKIILFFFFEDFQNGALYYYYNNFGSFFVNPLYNFSYYAIGIYFGSLNYVLQKRMTETDLEKQNKLFLLSFLHVLNFYKKKGILIKILNLFLCIIIIIFPLLYFIYSLFFNKIYYEEDNIYSGDFEEFIFGKFNNFFLLIDIEIYVFLIHLSCFLFCFDHNNAIKAFLTNSFWSIFNKLYIIFIVVINPIILYILFTSDMRIPINLLYCLLYTLISGFLTFIISILCYIFFELPCKRIITLIFKKPYKKIKMND